jgi:hypothetical protein
MTAMARFRRITPAWTVGATTVILALVATPLLLAAGASPPRAGSGGSATAATRPTGAFAWLHPGPAPAGWRGTTTARSGATLFYPPGWKPISGDRGTATAALRDGSGLYAGYVNVTPRQGAEQPAGWARFRIGHIRDEGGTGVRELAAAKGLQFRNGIGSCVIDEYLSRVGSHPYREIACIVSGQRNTGVFIGAALQHDWPTLGRTVEQAGSALLQR